MASHRQPGWWSYGQQKSGETKMDANTSPGETTTTPALENDLIARLAPDPTKSAQTDQPRRPSSGSLLGQVSSEKLAPNLPEMNLVRGPAESSAGVLPRSRGTAALDHPKKQEDTILLRTKVEELQNQLRQLNAQKQELSAQNIKLRTSMKDVLDRYDKSEADNSNLRAHIVSISKPPGQVNDDGFYIQKLNWLNEFTQQWVAGAFKGQRGQALESQKELELQRLLEKYNAGRALLELMQRSHTTLQTIYRIPDRRIALVRQLIAMFLSVYIFRPFCVGVRDDVSDILEETITHVFENGT